MIIGIRSVVLLATIFLVMPKPAFAQPLDPYTDKLKAGDAKSAAGDFTGAAADYDAAHRDAQTPTQVALALGKKALALVNKEDYASAKDAADEALEIGGSLEPVAEVTALQALGKCQLHDKDYAGALESMTRADDLVGVEWAKAEVAMIRGDAERGVAKFDEAVESYRKVVDMPDVSDGFKGVAWLNIGLTEQYSRNNSALAKEAYVKAVQLNPGLKAEADDHAAKIQ